jgi:predicted DNA-binding transcriptional regulator YafY
MPARMLSLLSLLQSRREWSGVELAERLGVTDRTVRRDIDRLRELGYPVSGTTGTAGGYRLARGSNVPPLLLDDGEAVAIAVALRTAGGAAGIEETAMRALAKLEQVLPARLRAQVAAIGDVAVTPPVTRGPQADPAVLAVVAAACRDDEILTFEYDTRDGATASRRVEPHHLMMTYGRWYLIAFDLRREDWRNFRIDRMRAPSPTAHRFQRRGLPARNLNAYLAERISAAPYRYGLEVVVEAPAEKVLERMRRMIPGRVEALGANRCVVRLGADTLEVFAQCLVAFDAEFSVSGSSEVLEYLRDVGTRFAAATAEPGKPPMAE